MKFQEILRILYGKDNSRIINLLNSSLHISDPRLPKQMTAYHTGFRFRIQTDSSIDVFADLSDPQKPRLVRQGSSYKWFPLLLGLKVTRDGEYFSLFYGDVMEGLSDCGGFRYYNDYTQAAIIENKLPYSTFRFFKPTDGFNEEPDMKFTELIEEFPLSRDFPSTLYFGDSCHYLNKPDYYEDRYDEDY